MGIMDDYAYQRRSAGSPKPTVRSGYAAGGGGGGGGGGSSWAAKPPTNPGFFRDGRDPSIARTAGVAATSIPAPTPQGGGGGGANAPVRSPSGGGGGGGGGGISTSALNIGASAPAPAAPTPITDVDWFNQDAEYRQGSGNALADLTSQLAQLLAQRNQGYQQIDMDRDEFSRNRQDDLLDVGQDFAGRGLGTSGLYQQAADRLSADYARRNSELDQAQQGFAGQYGQRDAQIDLGGLQQGNVNKFAGLLGSQGTGAANTYAKLLAQLQSESAARATQPLIRTIGA